MQYPHPSTFFADLTDERLNVVAAKMLDVRYQTIRQMDTEFDDNYTRECPVYGRTRNMLIALAQSKKFPWLGVKCMGMGIDISVGNVKCKFFRDDLENPEKAGFFKRDSYHYLFEDEEEDNFPLLWRFVIERALTEEDEDQVYFVGYNKFNDKVSMWHYECGSTPLYAVDPLIPSAANMEAAEIQVREEWDDEVENVTEFGNEPGALDIGTRSSE